MDFFKEFFHSVFSNSRAQRPPGESYPPQSDYERDGFEGSSFFSHEDIWREMDNTFDELFKIFGVDNIPMFDPYIPFVGKTHRPPVTDRQLPANANVRDQMLKGKDNSSLYPEQEVNVRSYMLKRNPTASSNKRSTWEEKDRSWDSLLQKGASVDEILDTNKQPSQSHPWADNSQPHSFTYTKITRTRRADGTVETRRITRDESGNEKETVEINGSP